MNLSIIRRQLFTNINININYDNNLSFYDNINNITNENIELYKCFKLSGLIKVCSYNDENYNYYFEKRTKKCKYYKNDENNEYNKNKHQKILIKDKMLIKKMNIIQKYLQYYIIGKNTHTYSLSQDDIYKIIFYYYLSLLD